MSDAEPKTYAVATVAVRLRITCRSRWDGNATLAQVRKQAAREALDMLDVLLSEKARNIVVDGDPLVQAVAMEEGSA